MSDKSQTTGKSMWDLVNEVESKPVPMRRHRTAETDELSDTGAADNEARVDIPVPSDQPNRRKRGGLIAAGIAVIALGATAFVYTQGTQSAKSGSIQTPAATLTALETGAGTTTAQVANQPIISPAAYGPAPIRFGDSLTSTTPAVAGKSLAHLIMAPATVAPVPALPASEWRSAECSSCHTWTQERLCDQGKWYQTHGDAAVKRIAHPYGGGFKRSLQAWAGDGCQ